MPYWQKTWDPRFALLVMDEEDEARAPAPQPSDPYECAVCKRSLRRGRYLIVKNCKHEECPHR